VLCFVFSYLLLSNSVMGFNMSLAKIEVGVAYAIWSALGSLVVSTVGIVFFGESCDASKLACLLLIVIGVVGLNLRG
jgi:small multidrug resistance pump